MSQKLLLDRTPLYSELAKICWNRPAFHLDQYTLPIYLSHIDVHNKVYVDIGARDDSIIPKQFLDNADFALFFECDQSKLSGYKDKGNPNFNLVTKKVNVENVLELFAPINGRDIKFLSIDIDGYDYFVLEKLLSSDIKPSLIVAECNEKIPAPIKFCINYDPNWYWKSGNFYGCSIAKYEELFLKYGYDLIDFTYGNLYAVRRDKNPNITTFTAQELYDKFYRNDPFRSHQFWYNQPLEKWLHANPVDAVEMIKEYFSEHESKYSISVY